MKYLKAYAPVLLLMVAMGFGFTTKHATFEQRPLSHIIFFGGVALGIYWLAIRERQRKRDIASGKLPPPPPPSPNDVPW